MPLSRECSPLMARGWKVTHMPSPGSRELTWSCLVGLLTCHMPSGDSWRLELGRMSGRGTGPRGHLCRKEVNEKERIHPLPT